MRQALFPDAPRERLDDARLVDGPSADSVACLFMTIGGGPFGVRQIPCAVDERHV
jgi:hypothetical protein